MSNTISIAVLPFRNISNNLENDFFCDGISEEIINALAKIEQLRVISRTSSFYFKDHKAPIKKIGEQLGVETLLEGSVRVRGNKLRITAQLIDVEEDSHFWSQRWDRKMENLFEIQDEISLLIADKLREHIGHLDIAEQLVDKHTDNLAAYQYYLKGRYHFNKWNSKDANIAITEFEKTVAIDKNLIDAYVGLADAYSFLAVAGFAPRAVAWAKAMEAMDIAKGIDESHAGLNYMLANQAFFTDANFAAALKHVLKALASVPTHVDSQRFVSFLYLLSGEIKKAKDHIFYAKSIDPLNPETLFYEALYYYRTEDYGRASTILDGLLKDNHRNLPAIVTNIYVKVKENRLKEALSLLKTTPEELLTPDERLGLQCVIEVSKPNLTTHLLSTLIQHAKSPGAHHAHSYLFMAYAILGKYEEAFTVLHNVFEHQSSILLLGFSDPLAANIKGSPRYQKYHKKIYPHTTTAAAVKKSRSKSPDPETIQKKLARLYKFMDTEKPFLNPALTLRLLGSYVAIHPNQLSWLLNEHVGKNFNEFVNQKRIEHFKKLAVDPSNAHISLIGLAYESGFNSKTVFNTTFKKEVGMTPKAYQKANLK